MKTFILSCLLSLIYINTNSSTINKINIQTIIIKKDIILETIIHVETNNENIAGKTGDIGYLQITLIFLNDVNRILGYNKYKPIDRWNKSKAIEMSYIHQKHYNPSYDFKLACLLHHNATNQKEQLYYFNKCKKMAIKLITKECMTEHKNMIMNYLSNQKSVKHSIIEVKTELIDTNFKIFNSSTALIISLSPNVHNIPLNIGNLIKHLM